MASPTPRPPLTRKVVVDAARALIEDEGLDAVSFRRLAQRLGVTAPALYAYVSDKDDLLRSVTIEELMAIIDQYDRVEGEAPLAAIRRYCLLYVEYATAHPALYRTIFLYPPWDVGVDAFGIPDVTQRYAVPYNVVVEAVESGLFKPVHPLLIALALWTATHGVADVLLQGIPGEPELRREFAEMVIDAAIEGLRNRPAGGDTGCA